MITVGEARGISSHVNTWLGMALIGVFTFAMGLILWQTAFGENPIANAFSAYAAQETQVR